MRIAPSPNGSEVKYFWTNLTDAIGFGMVINKKWFIPPLHVVSMYVPASLISDSMFIRLPEVSPTDIAVVVPLDVLSHATPARIITGIPR